MKVPLCLRLEEHERSLGCAIPLDGDVKISHVVKEEVDELLDLRFIEVRLQLHLVELYSILEADQTILWEGVVEQIGYCPQ